MQDGDKPTPSSGLLASREPVLSLSDNRPNLRRLMLCSLLLVWGVRGIFTNIVVTPTCDNSVGSDVCGNGQNGQNSVSEATSMWSCTTTELTVLQYITSVSGIQQVGFGSNIEPSGQCELYGCATHQCLKTTTKCGTGIPVVSHECMDGSSVVDLQPFVTFVLIGFLVLGVVLFFAPLELTNSRMLGILLVMYISYNFALQITVEKSCPWGDQTYSVCNTALPGNPVNNQSEVVQLYDCNRQSGASPFATNLPRTSYSMNKCQLYSCSANECLKKTTTCGVSDTETYECVGGEGSASAPPTVVFFDIGLLAFSLLFIIRGRSRVTLGRAIAVGLIVFGLHNMALSMAFVKSCDYSDQTTSFCGTGTDGQVANSEVVTVTPCFELDGFTTFPTPFTTNLKPVDECLQLDCGTNHCLKRTQTCTNGFPSGPITTECVLGRGMGAAAPVAMMFYMFMAGFGTLWYLAQLFGKGMHIAGVEL